jgi:hypothetical protein
MKYLLVLHFALSGHIHNVPTGHSFGDKASCDSAGQMARSYVTLKAGETYSWSCTQLR